MALTKLSDIVEPRVFLQYGKEYTPEMLDLLTSSAISSPPAEVVSQMGAGGSIIDMPFWQDTDRTEPDILTDDETVLATPKKITASQEKARKLYLGKVWQQADLAGVYATGSSKDPLKSIVDYTENYWRRMYQIYLVKMLDGIRADNVANDSGDMRATVYSDVASPAASNKLSPSALTTARLTMGEMMNELGTIVMHSKVYGDALNQEAITFVQPSNLPFKIAMFAGMQVIVSDDCTTVAGTNSPMYRSYLLGMGSVAQTVHYPEMAVETYREPLRGNGGGVESLITRRHCLLHPKGFQFTSASVAGKSPNWGELATAANWDRKMVRKNIKIGFLETN